MPLFRKRPITVRAHRTSEEVVLDTPHGQVVAAKGDWIIEDAKGGHYPCTDEIFRMTYEAVNGDGRAEMERVV
jgi:hypothetical protein